jgi:ferredoxin-NADP reductase
MDATLTKVMELGSYSLGLWFKPQGAFPQFIAGQHVTLVLKNESLTGANKAHTYTIASTPMELPEILIASKDSPSVFKKALRELEPGDSVTITNPIGDFYLHEGDRPVVMIAGGIGITPFRSMLMQAFHAGITRAIHVLYSNKTVDIAFKQDLDDLAVRYPALSMTYTVTEPAASWSGEKRLITSEFISDYCANPLGFDFYVCGPPGMVNACSAFLTELHVPQDQVYVERFTGYHALHPHSKQ